MHSTVGFLTFLLVLLSSGAVQAIGDRMDADGGSGYDHAAEKAQARMEARQAASEARQAALEARMQQQEAAEARRQQQEAAGARAAEAARIDRDNQRYHERAIERSEAILQSRLQQIQSNPNLSDTERRERSDVLKDRQRQCRGSVNYCFK